MYNTGVRECNSIYFIWSVILHGGGVLWILGPLVTYVIDITVKHGSYTSGSYRILYLSLIHI